MRILAGLLLLITAFVNLLAGLGYVAGGALTEGLVTTIIEIAGSLTQDLATQSGMEISPEMLAGLDTARNDGLAAGSLLLGYGAFLLVSVIVLLAGTMCLFRRSGAKVIYTAGAVAILGEAGSMALASFAIGIGNVIGLLAGLLALLAARGLTGAPIKVKGQSPTPAVKVDNDRPGFGLVDVVLAGMVGLGLLLLAGSGYLYYDRAFAGSLPMADAVAATPASTLVTTAKPKPKNLETRTAGNPPPQASSPKNDMGESARGSVRGTAFTMDRADYENGVLTLRQGEEFFADASFKIFLFDQNDSLPEESHYEVDGATAGLTPHVHVALKPEGKDAPDTNTYTSGYRMQLDFGERDGIMIPGRIRLEIPEDGPGSKVEGTFEARIGGWVEVLAPEDYVPDPRTDDFDTLKYLARAHLLDTHAGKDVKVLSFRDTSFGTFGENGGSGVVTLDFTIDGGQTESLEFNLEKNDQGWLVTKSSKKT